MNGKPYYSVDNGFACAASARGVTEALREHLNVIIRNEELEVETGHSQLQAEINDLVEDKKRLEKQKIGRQEKFRELTDKLADKDIELSEQESKLQAPIDTDTLPPDPRVDTLKDKLAEKNVERIKVETDLEAPTRVELPPSSVDETPQASSKRRLSISEWFLAILATAAVIGLIGYLFIFYASVGDRTFTKGIGDNTDKQQIIIPHALHEAWNVEKENPEDAPRNWFVILFPFVFLTLAILVYFCHQNKRWRILAGLLIATAFVDGIIAVKISQQMHEFTKGKDVPYLWSENWIEVLSVFLLGFGVSLLLGYGLYWIMNTWNRAKQPQDESERLELMKRVEQNDSLVQLAALTTKIQGLENRISDIQAESQQKMEVLIENNKHPIKVEIARLNTERETLQSQIKELTEQIESFQMEINQCENEIGKLVERQRKTFVDVKKLEMQAHEFISGWCRYITQQQSELPVNAGDQIEAVQHFGDKVIQAYTASLQTV